MTFLADGVTIGSEVTSAPYSVAWNTMAVANGSHTLTAVARDTAGNRASSAAVQVTVSNTAPLYSVAITSPAAGTRVSGKVAVSASAWAGVVGVRFYVDGLAIGTEDNFAPFSVSWDTSTSADGTHKLTAVARDLSGNVITSPAVNVDVHNGGGRHHPAH